jgi:hypothetical protein
MDLEGRTSIREFILNVRETDLSCDVTQSRRLTPLSCDFSTQVQGGFRLVAKQYGGKTIRQYQAKSEQKKPVKTETLPDAINAALRDTLLAGRLSPEYLVFHVSDASTRESVTRRYRYTDDDVIEASLELVNRITPWIQGVPLLLFENLWWTGLRLIRWVNPQYLVLEQISSNREEHEENLRRQVEWLRL